MTSRVGINGFGRIGRQVFKAIEQGGFDDLFQVVAVNDLSSPAALAHLLKYDSTYGRYDAEVAPTESGIQVNGREIKVLAERDPGKLPWEEQKVDVVIESTGFFTNADDAEAHLDAGAEKVVISAPAKGEDITVVLGVNEAAYDPDEQRHHLQRFLHHELSRAGREGDSRPVWRPPRADDDGPLDDERPGHPSTGRIRTCAAPARPARTLSRRVPAPREPSRSSFRS